MALFALFIMFVQHSSDLGQASYNLLSPKNSIAHVTTQTFTPKLDGNRWRSDKKDLATGRIEKGFCLHVIQNEMELLFKQQNFHR